MPGPSMEMLRLSMKMPGPERIPAIYYWDTIAINNTEEVD